MSDGHVHSAHRVYTKPISTNGDNFYVTCILLLYGYIEMIMTLYIIYLFVQFVLSLLQHGYYGNCIANWVFNEADNNYYLP